MALSFYFAATIRHFAVFFLTSNMLVKTHSDLLALFFLTSVDVIGTLRLSSVTPSGVDTISSSRTFFMFFWQFHLPACWYIFYILFIHLCSDEDLVHNDFSIPIFFIWSSRRDDCYIRLIATQFSSNMAIESIGSMALFSIRDLTHWAAWIVFCESGNKIILYQTGVIVLFCVNQQVEYVV